MQLLKISILFSNNLSMTAFTVNKFSLKCSDKVYIIVDFTIIFMSFFPPFPFYFYVPMAANNFILNFHSPKCFLLFSFFFFGTQSKQVLRVKEARDEILFCTIPDMICTKGGRSYNFNNTSRVVRELRVRLLIVYLEC